MFSYSNLKVSNDWPQGYDHFSLDRARGLAGDKVNETAHSNTFQNKTQIGEIGSIIANLAH